MHEMSIAIEVGRLAADQVEPERLPDVTAVGVEVGDRAGVVPDALEFCLEAVLGEAPFRDARPVLQRSRGDVLRLVWIEVEEPARPLDADGAPGAAGAVAPGLPDERRGGEEAPPGRGAGPEQGGAERPAGDVPLPSEAGPPPGAGDQRQPISTERGGTR